MRRATLIAVACALLAAAAGCGGGSGVAGGATVSVYVAAPLCDGARSALERAGGRAGSYRVRAVCLPPERSGGRLDLAAIGTNARRATQDSAAVAFLEPADPAANRFSETILEAAGIGTIEASSGQAAMGRVLRLLRGTDGSDLRQSVREALQGE